MKLLCVKGTARESRLRDNAMITIATRGGVRQWAVGAFFFVI